MIIHGAGTNHWFHNDLSNRSLILLVALTGNTGKNGGGFNHYVGQERIWPSRASSSSRSRKLGRSNASRTRHCGDMFIPPTKIPTFITA
jgi:nitrate reductase alpha subunit